MAGFAFVIDPVEDSPVTGPTNVELSLSDGSPSGIGYRVLEGTKLPDPALKTVYASSFDTEGDIPADEHSYGPGEMILRLRVTGSTDADLDSRLRALAEKQGKINREQGSMKVTMPSGQVRCYDLTEATGAPDITGAYGNRQRTTVELRYATKPFWRGTEVGNITDDFSVDTIASAAWAFDAGVGTIAVSGGQLVPSSTAEKRLYRTDRTLYDSEVTAKITTTTTVTNMRFGPMVKRLDASNYIRVRLGGDNLLRIEKTDAGATTSLASTAHTPSVSTSYWVRGRIEGNKVTAEVFTAAPTPSSTPAATTTFTLTGGDATKFGQGVAGNVGLGITPHATAERYDEFAALPNVYVEKTLPALVTPPIYGVKGDVTALTRMIVDEMSGQDQFWMPYGVQSRYLDTASTAALFYEAEALTPKGTAAIATVSGASGAGSNNAITEGTLTPTWTTMLSTQILSGSAHMTHIGDFRVWARVQMPLGNTGNVSIRLRWGAGDFRKPTANDGVYFDINHIREGQWMMIDLGLIHLRKAQQGAQRWEGRIDAKSTVLGDDLSVDCLMFFPCEPYSFVSGNQTLDVPSTYLGRDEFDQGAGSLTGKVAPVGGTYVGAGDASDFTLNTTAHTVERAVGLDADIDLGRFAVMGSTSAMTDTSVQADVKQTAADIGVYTGVVCRYVDVNNYLAGLLHYTGSSNAQAVIIKEIAGTYTAIATAMFIPGLTVNNFASIRLTADARGKVTFWAWPQGSFARSPILSVFDPDLATGGTLAAGKVGINDIHTGAPIVTRSYDNLVGFVPTFDAALFASRQLEIGSSYAIRQDVGGTIWSDVSRVINRVKLSPGAREGRASRLIMKGSRGDPDLDGDQGIDDLRMQVIHTPRYAS